MYITQTETSKPGSSVELADLKEYFLKYILLLFLNCLLCKLHICWIFSFQIIKFYGFITLLSVLLHMVTGAPLQSTGFQRLWTIILTFRRLWVRAWRKVFAKVCYDKTCFYLAHKRNHFFLIDVDQSNFTASTDSQKPSILAKESWLPLFIQAKCKLSAIGFSHHSFNFLTKRQKEHLATIQIDQNRNSFLSKAIAFSFKTIPLKDGGHI